ncbi:MAG: nucleoside-diphosphate kinase [Candidatus Altiarchaeales archaeon]|nr:MAG: nucleoside-diphosphate kinase [Candidatus Altiarchaeales archaeon]
MKTLIIIKPDGVKRGLVGEIISRFENYGFRIIALKILNLDRKMAEKLYAIHKGKSFFDSLIEYITSGPVVAAVLATDNLTPENGIKVVRKIVGATNPLEAEMGSIRGDYAFDISGNLIHASDSEESAEYEIPIFFNDNELID